MHDHNKSTDSRLPQLASYASLSVALLLIVLKFWAWAETNSVSILSSLADSFLDVLASAITVVAVWASSKPADREHRFGHGKSEGLAALLQSIAISLSAVYVCYEAIQRFITPQPIVSPETGIAVMAIAIVLTIGLQFFQHHVIKRTGSMAIAADAVHYRSDLLINFGVTATILISTWSDSLIVDPIVGICIAGCILYSTYGIGRKALDVLLDRELPDAERRRIKELAVAHPDVHGFHDLRTRFGGSRYFIQFHLELSPNKTLLQTHEILDEVESNVRAAFPLADIIVHPDPLGLEERRDEFD